MGDLSGTKDGVSAGAPAGRALGVDVLDSTGEVSPSTLAWLADRSSAAAAAFGAPEPPSGEVRVRIVADDEMAAAHQRYSNVPGTTDVLTFDLRESAAGPLDADLLICLDEARRQAAARRHAPERELLLYIVHGLLHCLGYDDHNEADARAMHEMEDRLLAAIGVGVTFARGGGA